MNFSEFGPWRQRCLAERPDLLDCGETNVYRALADLRPQPTGLSHTEPLDHAEPIDPSAAPTPIYRCDLARAWLQRYDFPAAWSRRALVCRGVRHALSLLFHERCLGKRIWRLPRDVYPVYFELARAAGIEPLSYATWPEVRFELGAPPLGDAQLAPEGLLVPNPLKPLGRFLTDAECETLLAWSAAGTDRYVVIDAAYDLGTPLHSTSRRLFDSGRTILLHSFTKNWLSPRTFGVALVPEWTPPTVTEAFRADSPSADQLGWARDCLMVHDTIPSQVAAELDRRRAALFDQLPAVVRDRVLPPINRAAPGIYLFPVKMNSSGLVGDFGVLALPGTAFGGPIEWSVLTSLAEPFRTPAGIGRTERNSVGPAPRIERGAGGRPIAGEPVDGGSTGE